MADVFILCAGASSRFNQKRPKWLLTHPNGKPLFARAVEGLSGRVGRIWMVVLEKHLEDNGVGVEQIQEQLGCSVLVLDKRTPSQAHTAALALKMVEPRGAVFFKDCDSYFEHQLEDENCVVTTRIDHESAPLDLHAKCFIQSNTSGTIQNIVEKRVVSDEFAIGGYGFESASVFARAFARAEKAESELFLSHVVLASILEGQAFFSRSATGYEDYGTPEALRAEIKKYGTIFVDLDGTLLESAGAIGGTTWGCARPIQENIQALQRLHRTGRYQVIITTARPESLRALTERELAVYGIPSTILLMGLLSAPRTLINDYAPQSPETARCIQLERNSPTLAWWLMGLK